jgi:ribose-phosphate pyrophosphokinase
MKILNLVRPSSSQISFKISQFPDGQQDITVDYGLGSLEKVKILARFNSFKDLELIICATKALRGVGVKDIHLFVPYILGARSDRQFVEGGTSYLRDVIAPILNSLNFESVQCIDVHSDVAAACINNLKVHSNADLVKSVLNSLYSNSDFSTSCIFVSPDAGSLKKIYKAAEYTGFTGEVLTCSKYRDTDGKLSKTYVPVRVDHFTKDMIIIDDICDGGRTFLNIAEEIKKAQPERTGKIYLVVTHGIFSAGFDQLAQHLNGVYCTNSYSDILSNSLVYQLDVF